jgi:Cellulase (glycosyl hydrolase family 5)
MTHSETSSRFCGGCDHRGKRAGPDCPGGISRLTRGGGLRGHGRVLPDVRSCSYAVAGGRERDGARQPKTTSLKVEEEARKAWGPTELHAIRCFGANTVRIHIAQPSADPLNAEFSPSHLTEFVSAVKLAPQQGLAVIVDMQDEPLSGEHHSLYNPTAATLRAWEKLAPMLANIPGVMLELFNEPLLEASEPGAWKIWLDGGKVTKPRPATTVGVQTMVNKIRELGADNPIVVMGLLPGDGTGGWTLQGMPAVKDPIKGPSQLAFSVHFPPTKTTVRQEQPRWDTAFGKTSATLPVMVGAFNVSSKARCTAQAPQTGTDLVTKYLTTKKVGIAGWAFDYPSSIFLLPGGQGALTNFTNFSCEGKGFSGKFGGDGQLLYTAYTEEGNGT